MTGEEDKLDDFYTTIKSGTTVSNFLEKYDCIFRFIRSEGLTEHYRLGSGRVKKLRDEVTPVARFVRKFAELEDRILFALSDKTPDCCVMHEGNRLREIEVTVAQGTERFYVMRELNETGTGRGHLGLSDDAPTDHFKERMNQPRSGYTGEEIGRTLICAVAICARKKSRFTGDTLLIDAPLETLPGNRWDDFWKALANEVGKFTFNEVYVTGRSDQEICQRIK